MKWQGFLRVTTGLSLQILLMGGWSAASQATTDNAPTHSRIKANVLVLHSYNLDLSWTKQQQSGIDQGFQDSEHEVTVYHEFLDAKRYPSLSYRQDFFNYLEAKYQDTSFQVLMVADDPGLNLILQNRDDYFSELPVVFLGINHVREELLTQPWLTGVFETHSVLETIVEAKRQTESDSLIVISDSSETGQANLLKLETLKFEAGVPSNLVIVQDLYTTQISQKLDSYPDHWPIFLSGQLRDDDGNHSLIEFEQGTQLLSSALPNPIYVDAFMYLGHGAVGGKILEGNYHAQQAVDLVEQLLSGTPIGDIEPVIESQNQWMFDVKALQRAHINTTLPVGSVLINATPSFYEQHRKLVWLAVVIFSLGVIVIVLLVNAIYRQKRAEQKLRENEQQLEMRVTERTTELQDALCTLQQTQVQLIQTEKLSGLGQLVGGIAHEFNNPLSFIYGNTAYLQDYIQNLMGLLQLHQEQPVTDPNILKYAEDIDLDYIQKDAPKVIQSIQTGVERIQTIVRTLQQFSRSDEQGIKTADLNQSLDSTLLILKAQLPQDMEVIKDYDPLPLVSCQPGELNQVFMNILINAIQAMEKIDQFPKQLIIRTLVLSDEWVQISIQDTGPGIPHALQDKVFDPFFTTKPVGQGTGLGLASAYQIVQKHQGKLKLFSEEGKGTEFIIDLRINLPMTSFSSGQPR